MTHPTEVAIWKLLKLRENWDSHGSKKVPLMAAADAVIFWRQAVGSCGHQPKVVPIASGGVELEWYRGEQFDITAEFYGDSRYWLGNSPFRGQEGHDAEKGFVKEPKGLAMSLFRSDSPAFQPGGTFEGMATNYVYAPDPGKSVVFEVVDEEREV